MKVLRISFVSGMEGCEAGRGRGPRLWGGPTAWAGTHLAVPRPRRPALLRSSFTGLWGMGEQGGSGGSMTSGQPRGVPGAGSAHVAAAEWEAANALLTDAERTAVGRSESVLSGCEFEYAFWESNYLKQVWRSVIVSSRYL